MNCDKIFMYCIKYDYIRSDCKKIYDKCLNGNNNRVRKKKSLPVALSETDSKVCFKGEGHVFTSNTR